ncbi:hypothetical protein ACFVH7_17830 [Kitasatospora indigofera]|uniref:hypothetical protein n=1 Tax=Kitasatospora indigofera TaxID=67307 RepID=UPI00362A3A31
MSRSTTPLLNAVVVTISVEGEMEPAQLPLPDALRTLWHTLQALQLGSHQYEAYRHFFGEGVEQRVLRALEEHSRIDLAFRLKSDIRLVKIQLAVPAEP